MKRSQIDLRGRRLIDYVSGFSVHYVIAFCSVPISSFRPKSGIYPGTAEISLVRPVFKPAQNTNVYVPVYASVQ